MHRVLFAPTSDLFYTLEHSDKYIAQMKDKGRKICVCIEGAGKGIGFCNMTDAQIADFVSQVKVFVETYDLDGINLWDRGAGYGKEGMPAMNTTSYPKLIKAMREALGKDRLLTVVDYEEPTEYFYDTSATGGIAVGVILTMHGMDMYLKMNQLCFVIHITQIHCMYNEFSVSLLLD